ncbi:hypothetical protein EC968_002369 [Mortierella alpina]|nr:hypothetical protein EC968_002369 [Mortierella alpina]
MTLFHERTGQLRTWARRTIWSIVVTGSLCAVVIPIFSIYRREGDNARSVVEVGPQGVSHTGDFIHVVGSVANVDFEDKNFRVHFEFTPHGTLTGDDGVLTAAISMSLFYTTLTFPVAQIMRSVDVTMPYMQGATIDYPFDAYKSYFEIMANLEKEQLHKIPVSLTFQGMLQSVEFIPTVRLSNEDLYKIAIEISTRRSPTTIGFSLFIVMIMWCLSISIGIIAIQVIRKYRVSDEHVLTLGITTLFALPALRETQPGIPSIGCAADVLGFYWNMAIIAIASILILMASALRWKEPSIDREIELVRKQHDMQSELISGMSIPMPFPITGGPFSDHQLKKKRMPFMTDHGPHRTHQQHLTREHHKSRGGRHPTSPLYSDGGHEYHRTSENDDYFYYTEDPEHPECLLREHHYRQHQMEEQQRQQQQQDLEAGLLCQDQRSHPSVMSLTSSSSSSAQAQRQRQLSLTPSLSTLHNSEAPSPRVSQDPSENIDQQSAFSRASTYPPIHHPMMTYQALNMHPPPPKPSQQQQRQQQQQQQQQQSSSNSMPITAEWNTMTAKHPLNPHDSIVPQDPHVPFSQPISVSSTSAVSSAGNFNIDSRHSSTY